jgi:hypothetical protein
VSLLHATDAAHALLRRAQVLLAGAAVVIAAVVGVLAGASRAHPSPPGAGTTQAELLEPARAADVAVAGAPVPVAARWTGPHGEPHSGTVHVPAGLPAGAAVTIALDDGGAVVGTPPAVAGPAGTGLVAGIGTLAACWGLLAVAGGIWRARLTARDRRTLAREWARVEPVWSGRRV